MASLGSKNLIWHRRCCFYLGNPTTTPCLAATQPYGSIDSKYWVEVTGDYTPGTDYDVYSNLKARFWLESIDNGYFASCASEDGQTLQGCGGMDYLYMNTTATGVNWKQIHAWDNNRADRPSRDLGTYSISGEIRVPAGQTVTYTVARSYSCGNYEPFDITFRKPEKPDLSECTRPSVSLSCSGSTSSVYEGVLNISGSWGKNIDRDGNDVTSHNQSWTVSPGGRTGSGSSVTGLQPNSRYSVTVTRNNGCASASATCSFTTLCGNTLSNCRSTKSDEIQFDCTILGGYGEYAPTTTFRYRAYGTVGWNTVDFTSKTKTKTTVTISGLKRDTSYEVQACTRTTAGEYCGNIITCRTIPGAYAIIDSDDPFIYEDPDGQHPPNTRCTLCYSWNADCAPVDLQVYYRVKNGENQTWLKSEVYTTDKKSGSHCILLKDLIPDYTVYECFVRATGCDNVSWDSPMYDFTTPPLDRPAGNNCNTLEYMVELICQALDAIKKGNMTIYANKESKEKCDPYSEHPTMTTFWSRFFRWAGAASCLLCDMVDFLIKSGKKDQYFTGEIGWVDILKYVEDEYDETDDDRLRLASSGAVYDLIQRSLHAVWHLHGTVDYILDDLKSVPSDAKNVINLSDNKVYTKSGSSWKVSTTIDQPDDFAVYHISKESRTTKYGIIHAETEYYYWDGTWNNLDASMENMDGRLDVLENHPDFLTTEGMSKKMAVVEEDFDFVKNGVEGVIYFVVEKESSAEPVYRTVTFDVQEGQPPVAPQRVIDGAYAQQPSAEPMEDDCEFGGWFKDGDEPPTCEQEGYIPKW